MQENLKWSIAVAVGITAGTLLDAAPVSIEQVQTAAEHWIERSAVFRQDTARNHIHYTCDTITPIRTHTLNPVMAYHVALEPTGYIVVSADDRMYPVLCFSTETELILSARPDNALRKLLFDDLDVCTHTLRQLDLAGTATPGFVADHRAAWAHLLDPRCFDYDPTNILVNTLLETQWSQWNHYNELCPVDPAPGSSYDGRVPVGCVAVAGAQLMKFYQWPPHGWGGHSYTDSEPTITGAHTAVFSDPYDWDNMQTGYYAYGYVPRTQEMAVSELIYETGVAVNMDYGSYSNDGGSSASIDDLGSALSMYFFYEPHTHLYRSTNPDTFDQLLRDGILAGDPVIVSIPGHAIIADGLSSDAQTNYFHINYGWGGINDGWYLPSDINGNSFYKGIFGPVPALLPLLSAFGETTNTSGIITNHWTFPERRRDAVTHYQLNQGQYGPTNITDTGQRYTAWRQYGSPWTNRPADGRPGACYYKPNAQNTGAGFMCSEPFIPQTGTVLHFDYKAQLYQDHFYVEITEDQGRSWDVLLHETGYPEGYTNGWWEAQFPLTAYAGSECLLRFRYASGTYWNGDYGVYVDNISYSNLQALNWTVVDGNIASNATSHVISNLSDGVYYYTLAAATAEGLQDASIPVSVTVSIENGDCDKDGIPDAWELAYFGSVTGATDSADSDGDTFTNWEEWRTGCNPTNAASFFAICAVTATVEQVTVSWPSISNRTYALYRGTNLVSSLFSCLQSNIPSTPPANTYTHTNTLLSASVFFRICTE